MKGDYQNGRIYKIEPICDHEDNNIYFGSTTQLLCKRMDSHRAKFKLWKNGKTSKVTVYDLFDKYGVENCKIYLVELFPCNSREELEAREGYYIKNNACVNRIIVGRTKKQYRIDNIEKVLEAERKYYKDNTEQILKNRKLFYNANKDKILEKNKKKFNCECGSCLRYVDKAQHVKTIKHKKYQNKIDELKELNKMHNEMIQKHKEIYKI